MLSLGTAEHVGSHFWLSQRFGAPGAVQDAKVIEGRVRSDVGLISRTAELPGRVLEIYGPTGKRSFLLGSPSRRRGTQTSLVRTGQSMRTHACCAVACLCAGWRVHSRLVLARPFFRNDGCITVPHPEESRFADLRGSVRGGSEIPIGVHNYQFGHDVVRHS